MGEIETFTLARVATFRSALPAAFACPRQGLAAPSTRGRIELEPWTLAGGGGSLLEGLEGFSHVWVVFMFDKNRHSSTSFDPSSSFLRPTVKPPWLAGADGKRGSCGVFATRSPHRPNPVGLTLCQLDRVDLEAGVIFVSGVDVIDGSAVLDVKPYHPVDSVPPEEARRAEAWPSAEPGRPAAGPAEGPAGAAPRGARFAAWMPKPVPSAEVRWRDDAVKQLEELRARCTFYPDGRDAPGDADGAAPLEALRRAVDEVLGLDPRTPQSRSKGAKKNETTHRYWAFDIDGLSIAFRLAAEGGAAAAGEGEDAVKRPATFEVLRVEPMGDGAAAGDDSRSSKAWLEALRADLEPEASTKQPDPPP